MKMISDSVGVKTATEFESMYVYMQRSNLRLVYLLLVVTLIMTIKNKTKCFFFIILGLKVHVT